MDGITFGILYWVSAIMPFDLKHLPAEQNIYQSNPDGGKSQEVRNWRLSGTDEVTMTHLWASSGIIMRTYYKVDTAGRILSESTTYTDGAKAAAEYSYESGNLARVKHTYQGSPNAEDLFTWSDGKLATATYIDYETKRTSVYTFGWKGDRIDTVHTPASFPEGVVLKYEYPSEDSVRMVMYRPSGPYATGYKLKGGHIVSESGFFNSEFRYTTPLGVRARMPMGVRPMGPMAEGRDWLGREMGRLP